MEKERKKIQKKNINIKKLQIKIINQIKNKSNYFKINNPNFLHLRSLN